MKYQHRISKVTDYIGKHLDDELSLDQLSGIACFSKYHFHRLFMAYTGLTLQHYIRWLRLKRAAHQLMVEKDSPIITIAISAGFESHESFTRAFKQICGVNPSDFRLEPDWHAWEKPPFCLPKRGEKMMNVTIKNESARQLAVVEHRGDPYKLIDSYNKLINWMNSQPMNLKLQPGEAFGFAYDDPNKTAPEDFRFDIGITVAKGVKVGGGLVEKQLPAGRYAVALHKGSRDTIGDTVYGLYRDWLPESLEELGDLPCIFCYQNFDHEVAETELLTECWLLLK